MNTTLPVAVLPTWAAIASLAAVGAAAELPSLAGLRLNFADPSRVTVAGALGTVIAACRSRRVFVINQDGRLAGCGDRQVPIKPLLRPGGHRANTPFMVRTADGGPLA